MTDVAARAEQRVINMGGTATLFGIDGLSGIGALTGTINGAAYAAPTSEMKDLGDGRVEFTGYHYFIDRDGSTLYTNDKAVLSPAPGGETILEVEYTVVEASGRFDGYGGTFASRGWLSGGQDVQHPIGMVRFEGAIRR